MISKSYSKSLLLIIALLTLSYCRNLERTIDFVLPAYTSKMVVECYLEVGKPYRLLLTESVSYFAPPELPPLLNATVTITHRGQKDTLFPRLTQDTTINRVFSHVSKRIIDQWNEDEYVLEISDRQGRKLKSSTRFLPAPRLDTIQTTFRLTPDTTAFMLIRFWDNSPEQDNFYRLVVNKKSLKGSREVDFAWQPRIITDNRISVGTSYRFKERDTLIISLYHIQAEYLEFLRTVSDANQANGNPFAQPATIRSNIQGGLGIFTTLSYDRRRYIVPKR